MSSIRPLFTIIVLGIVGVYLYVKINEGPGRATTTASAAHGESPEGVPPLAAAAGGATLAQDSAAPAWPPANVPPAPAFSSTTGSPNAAPPAGPQASQATPADADNSKAGVPEVPPIPELPELPKAADAAPIAQAAIPAASPQYTANPRYGNDAGPQFGAGSTPDTSSLPPLPTLPSSSVDAAAATPPAVDALPTTPDLGASTSDYRNPPAGASAATSPLLGSQPAASATPTSLSAAPATDRYGMSTATATEPPSTTPIAPPSADTGESFATSWPAIQAALDRRDLKQAHQLLSKWHGNETLTAAETQKVESLLGELAGTVIYSTEHQLEPARVVKPGETLDTIAKEYGVPWQLLAKINGIPAPQQIQPGQELKVVRGPFSAVVDLHRGELTLEVDGRYAGTFPINVAPGSVNEGQWLVDQKLAGSSGAAAQATGVTPASDRIIVLRSATGGALPAPALTIVSETSAATVQSAAIRVTPQDAEDLSDILSVGSRVIVRR
jgi:LysM repeat protein